MQSSTEGGKRQDALAAAGMDDLLLLKWLDSYRCSVSRFQGDKPGQHALQCTSSGKQATVCAAACRRTCWIAAGNWPAIIFGVTITTLGLLAVVAAGCYSDLKKLAAGDHRRRKPQVNQKPAAVAGNAALLSEPHIHRQ